MNRKEADYIIKKYKPETGFINLSKKPINLNKMTYAKILQCQNYFIEVNRNIEYWKQDFNKVHFRDIQEASAKLQHIILKYWKI